MKVISEDCSHCNGKMVHTETYDDENCGVLIYVQVWTCPKCILKNGEQCHKRIDKGLGD